jgi:hypothetical protein
MITRFAGIAAIAAAMVSGCGSTTTAPPVTVTQTTVAQAPSPVATTTEAPAPVHVTIPEVTGQNAEIVRKNLEDLGLTDVNLSSANPMYSVVVLASNWTVVSIEPAPGTLVNADDPIVVKVTKE